MRLIATRRGGRVKDIPGDRRRMFDDKRRKRGVTVTVTTWVGKSIGAMHVYVNIEEDENPIYHPGGVPPFDVDPCWVTAWDDQEAKGRSRSFDFMSYELAMASIERLVAENFPGRRIRRIDDRVGKRWWKKLAPISRREAEFRGERS